MTRIQLPPVLRRWRFLAAVIGVSALAGGGVLLAAVSDPATALALHTVPTTRILDTRPATQVGNEAEPLGLGETIDLQVKNLPTDATAVSINVTVVDGTEGSFLTVYPKGAARPTTSTVNWDSAGAEANSAIVTLGTDQSVTIYNLKGTVNVVHRPARLLRTDHKHPDRSHHSDHSEHSGRIRLCERQRSSDRACRYGGSV